MAEDDDDQSTLILDFNALKDELESREKLDDIEPSELEFAGSATSPENHIDKSFDLDLSSEQSLNQETKPTIHFFEYKSSFFTEMKSKLSEYMLPIIHSELKELNKILMKRGPVVIVFFYNNAPKVVNQLSMQMKLKFPKASAFIIATNLSSNKVEIHKNSKFGAKGYMSEPFETDALFREIKKII